MIDALSRDLREALRQLRRKPAFTATAILTLAIGMGVNTVAFSVVNGLLFKGFASKVARDTGRIATTPGGDESGNASLQEYERLAAATSGALDLAAEGRLSMARQREHTTEAVWVLAVSSNYFSIVNASLIAGQLKVERVAGGWPSVVIGERFWREKLASASLAGLTLRLNHADVNVSGVMAESFTGPAGLYSPDVWVPIDDLKLFGASPTLQKRDARWLFLVGRLTGEATPAEVQGRVDTAAATMARDWPDTHKNRGARFRMFGEANSERRGIATAAAIGMTLIGLVLLVACFNVANLLLARAVERERDLGIRTALGAGPARLTRLVIVEGFVIATAAGILALLIAWWTQSLVSGFAIPIDEPQHIDFSLDLTIVSFIIGLVIVAGVLPGLWPALAAARVDVLRVLGSQGANSAIGKPSAMRRWLVGAQIAGSTAFLAVAALFLQSIGRIVDLDLGFSRDHLVVAEFEPAANGYAPNAAERYGQALLARARSLPGVTNAALVDRAPFFIGFERVTPVWPEGGTCDGNTCPKIATLAAGPGYFQTMGIPLVVGREFEFARSTAEVVINQPFARKQWPDGRGLGETLRIGERGAVVTVVGITAAHRTRGLDWEQPTLYLPLGLEQYEQKLAIVARTGGDPSTMVRPLEAAAHAIDPNVAMLGIKTMEQRMGVQMWPFRTLSRLFSICGTLALVLATVGLASAVVHAVSRRRREFGVRLSIGATPRDLVVNVLLNSFALLVPGLILGTILAASAAKLVQVIFLGVNVLNPLTYLAVALLQAAIVIVACLGPALRASRVNPLLALRAE